MKTAIASLVLLAGVLHGSAWAQTQALWRCGVDGRLYTSQPCEQGRELVAPQDRPDADLRDARQRAARERQQSRQIDQERLQSQRRAHALGPAGFGQSMPAAAPGPASTPAKALAEPQRLRPARPEAGDTSTRVARVTRRAQG